jgi:hypothetical protein
VHYGGVYFFLYPDIKRLREATGELINGQENAFFAGGALDSLEAFLMKAQEFARSQTPEWEQRVGVLEGGEIQYQRTSRAQVLDLLQGIARAVQKAREENMGVLFLGD